MNQSEERVPKRYSTSRRRVTHFEWRVSARREPVLRPKAGCATKLVTTKPRIVASALLSDRFDDRFDEWQLLHTHGVGARAVVARGTLGVAVLLVHLLDQSEHVRLRVG